MNAIAMLQRCGERQRGPGIVIEGPVCHYCRHEAATEMAAGHHACFVCAMSVATERLMTKYRREP